jgi:REP element-mobilizing transposase RayT
MSSHLRRLDRLWADHPIYFITTCTQNRQSLLATTAIHAICRDVWTNCESLYHWFVGRYVVMPDHVHFFCAPRPEAAALSVFVGKWKEWTTKYAKRRLGIAPSLWQAEFFDHVLRSCERYEEKWQYVRMNPVRAKLVDRPEDWPHQGEVHDLRYD